MRKKIIITRIDVAFGIIIGIIILSMFFYIYWTSWRFEKIDTLANAQVNHINDYKNYFYRTEFVLRRSWITGKNVGRQIIYFLPGQKEKMLEKIKDDITNYLEQLVAEHGYIFYRYEISDDLKYVRIYKISSYLYELEIVSRILSLTGLYNSIRKGSSASIYDDYMFEIIESKN